MASAVGASLAGRASALRYNIVKLCLFSHFLASSLLANHRSIMFSGSLVK